MSHAPIKTKGLFQRQAQDNNATKLGVYNGRIVMTRQNSKGLIEPIRIQRGPATFEPLNGPEDGHRSIMKLVPYISDSSALGLLADYLVLLESVGPLAEAIPDHKDGVFSHWKDDVSIINTHLYKYSNRVSNASP